MERTPQQVTLMTWQGPSHWPTGQNLAQLLIGTIHTESEKTSSFTVFSFGALRLFLHEVQVALGSPPSPLFGGWLESESCPKLPCLILDEARRSQKVDSLNNLVKIGLIFFFRKLFYGKLEFIIDKGLFKKRQPKTEQDVTVCVLLWKSLNEKFTFFYTYWSE